MIYLKGQFQQFQLVFTFFSKGILLFRLSHNALLICSGCCLGGVVGIAYWITVQYISITILILGKLFSKGSLAFFSEPGCGSRSPVVGHGHRRSLGNCTPGRSYALRFLFNSVYLYEEKRAILFLLIHRKHPR